MSEQVIEVSGSDEHEFVPVKSADRTLDVLEALASGASSLSELSARLGIPKSSLHSILRTLDHRGWVDADASRSTYSLGMNALLIGSSYVDQDPTVIRTSEALDRLAAETGETVHLARLELPDVVYLAKRESTHPLRMFSAIGRRLPAHSTALGKAMLAELPDETVRRLLPERLAAATDHTITLTRRAHRAPRRDPAAGLCHRRGRGGARDAVLRDRAALRASVEGCHQLLGTHRTTSTRRESARSSSRSWRPATS